MQTRGFTLIELVVSLGILVMMTTIALPLVNKNKQPELMISEMLKLQSLAMVSGTQQEIVINGHKQFHYNNRGNVSSALSFNYAQHRIIVRLGYGNIRYE